MATTVKSRPTHYEVLGVQPGAPAHEIARAFAKEGSVFRPHAFGGLAELCLAYETLKDPEKRRAYDASLGIRRDAGPKLVPILGRMLASANAAPQPTPARSSAVEDRSESATKPAVPLRQDAEPLVRPEPRLGRGEAPLPSLEDGTTDEAAPIDWRRAGIALGAIVVAACALGGAAGWWSASAIEEQPGPTNSVSVPLPHATPVQLAADQPGAPEPVPEVRDAESSPRPAIETAPPIEQEPVSAQPVANVEPPPPGLTEASVDEPVAEESVDEPKAASTMPLPNRVIARTIDLIGYSCGQVASVEPIEGKAAGVHKVTCSSGQSFQATPVNGRYRFRRLGGR